METVHQIRYVFLVALLCNFITIYKYKCLFITVIFSYNAMSHRVSPGPMLLLSFINQEKFWPLEIEQDSWSPSPFDGSNLTDWLTNSVLGLGDGLRWPLEECTDITTDNRKAL